MRFELDTLEDGAVRVRLEGRLDAQGAQEIEVPLTAATAQVKRLIVDLGDVPYIASIGIRLLFTLARTASRRGGKVVLTNPSPTVSAALLSTGVDKVIAMTSSLEEARALLPAEA